jgi:glycogen operon protein
MVSQGVPMILMGDEIGRTQYGNNNTYCHDNEINWLNWSLKETNSDLFNFCKHIISFRHHHPVLRNNKHLQNTDVLNTGYPDISFHGTIPWQADWSDSSRVFAFMLDGEYVQNGNKKDDFVYVAMNMYWEALIFELPHLPQNKNWYVSVNTDVPSPFDFHQLSNEPKIEDQNHFTVGPRSVIILIGK